jgi:hypothetical protein
MAYDTVIFDLPPILDRCGKLIPDVSHKDDGCIERILHLCEQRLCCNVECHITTSSYANLRLSLRITETGKVNVTVIYVFSPYGMYSVNFYWVCSVFRRSRILKHTANLTRDACADFQEL